VHPSRPTQYPVLGLSALPRTDRPAAVEELAHARARRLAAGDRSVSSAVDLAGGRLVVYFPDANLFDGSAELESRGFFDGDNMPPWDTWVAYVDDGADQTRSYDSYLVSWVPPTLLDLADGAVAVNPEQCIVWAEDLGAPFRRQLEAAGLLR
jgi:hypothetical protein